MGCRRGSSECSGVDGQITQTHEAQGLGKDAFRCHFIFPSHPHTNERKSKKEVEDELCLMKMKADRRGGDYMNGKSCRLDL